VDNDGQYLIKVEENW